MTGALRRLLHPARTQRCVLAPSRLYTNRGTAHGAQPDVTSATRLSSPAHESADHVLDANAATAAAGPSSSLSNQAVLPSGSSPATPTVNEAEKGSSHAETTPLRVSDVTARVYFANPLIGLGVRKFAAGRIVRHVGKDEYAVALENVRLSPLLEVNTRVRVRIGYTAQHTGRIVAGVVTAVNSNGTVSVFLDNNTFVSQLPPSQVYLAESRGRLLGYVGFHQLLDWIVDAGVTRRSQAERIATALFYRGWRAETMYRLQKSDLNPMTYLRKSDRLVVADKAEWQRLHHVEMRGLLRERMKERDWRYFIQKYSGFVSANWAAIGVLSVFMWQLTNYRRHQRSTQLKFAVHTLTRSHTRYTTVDRQEDEAAYDTATATTTSAEATRRDARGESTYTPGGTSISPPSPEKTPRSGGGVDFMMQESLVGRAYSTVHDLLFGRSATASARGRGDPHWDSAHDRHHHQHDHHGDLDNSAPYFFVDRPREENWARQILREFDLTRPRIAVFTGLRGCGKSALLRRAIDLENKPALLVEVRGNEDALACIMRALRVPNAEACGNYLDFITDAFRKATQINGEPPVLVVTLRDGMGLSRLYNEIVTLACDRMLCHVLVEVSLESLSTAASSTTVTSASSIKEWALPRLDFYSVPNFTPTEAHRYTQHAIDPVATQHFIEVIGTNAADIDELFAAVRQREVDAVSYINTKLNWAMKQLRMALEQPPPTSSSVAARNGSASRPAAAPGTLSMMLGAHGDGAAELGTALVPTTHLTTAAGATSSSASSTSSSVAAAGAGMRRPRLHASLKRLAAFDFASGQHAAAQIEDLRDPALEDIVLYDPILDRWVFKEKVFHTAARSCL